jgi:hypothetical protein
LAEHKKEKRNRPDIFFGLEFQKKRIIIT